jgi:membrane peptidoglycan carboxypeptidase
MAGAYATLDNHGQRITPWSVLALSRNGESKPLPQHKAVAALSRGTADTVTSVLEDVVSDSGTGYRALDLNRPAAGKTGTTDQNLSAWFVGYTPQLVTSVGLFAEDPTTHGKLPLGTAAGISRVNGGSFPASIWTDYMTKALSGLPVKDFDLRIPSEYAGRGGNPTPSGTPSSGPPPTSAPTNRPTATRSPSAPATTRAPTTGPPTTSPAPAPTTATPAATAVPANP